MIGIKKYTHKQRLNIAQSLIPIIKKRFGTNLIGVAVRGSTARNEDKPYSDLELFAFIKKMPVDESWHGYGKKRLIYDGLCIELLWLTKDTYLSEVKEVNANWYGQGSEILLPIFNDKFITKLNKYKPQNIEKKCLTQALQLWGQLLFNTYSLNKSIQNKEKTQFILSLHKYYETILTILSFINLTPYSSYSTRIKQLKKFKIKPKSINSLTTTLINGNFQNKNKIKDIISRTNIELLEIFKDRGFSLTLETEISNKKRSDKFGMIDKKTRYQQALQDWDKVQEASTKVLNAAITKDISGMTLVINDMIMQYLKVLSCINGKTLRFSKLFDDGKKLKYKPKGFVKLINIIANGKYKELSTIDKLVKNVFAELEEYFERKGYDLYAKEIKINNFK